MKNNDDALSDLRRILIERDPQYRRAHAIIDTSTLDLDDSLEAIMEVIPQEMMQRPTDEEPV